MSANDTGERLFTPDLYGFQPCLQPQSVSILLQPTPYPHSGCCKQISQPQKRIIVAKSATVRC